MSLDPNDPNEVDNRRKLRDALREVDLRRALRGVRAIGALWMADPPSPDVAKAIGVLDRALVKALQEDR